MWFKPTSHSTFFYFNISGIAILLDFHFISNHAGVSCEYLYPQKIFNDLITL